MNSQIENLQIVIRALENKAYQLEMLAHFLTILFLGAVLIMLLVVLQYRLLKEKNRLLQMQIDELEKTNHTMFNRYIANPKSPNARIENN